VKPQPYSTISADPQTTIKWCLYTPIVTPTAHDTWKPWCYHGNHDVTIGACD